MTSKEMLRRHFAEASATQAAFADDPTNLEAVERFIDLAARTLEAGGRLLVCGNGGSMADAMHFAAEWTGRFRRDRRALPALALSDPVEITAIANDLGFEHVFSRQVEAHAQAGDLLVLLSTSGDSANLARAAEQAKAMNVLTVALLGRGGGKLLPLVDVPIVVPRAPNADGVQEVHIQVLHACIEALEHELGLESTSES